MIRRARLRRLANPATGTVTLAEFLAADGLAAWVTVDRLGPAVLGPYPFTASLAGSLAIGLAVAADPPTTDEEATALLASLDVPVLAVAVDGTRDDLVILGDPITPTGGLWQSTVAEFLAAGGGGVTLSDVDPADLGIAAPGVGEAAARDDHVHARPGVLLGYTHRDTTATTTHSGTPDVLTPEPITGMAVTFTPPDGVTDVEVEAAGYPYRSGSGTSNTVAWCLHDGAAVVTGSTLEVEPSAATALTRRATYAAVLPVTAGVTYTWTLAHAGGSTGVAPVFRTTASLRSALIRVRAA